MINYEVFLMIIFKPEDIFGYLEGRWKSYQFKGWALNR